MTFSREHFVSAPDEVFVSRLTADKPGALSFTVALDRPERFETTAAGAERTADDRHAQRRPRRQGRDLRGAAARAGPRRHA